ncbi:unnamed protein product [Didymodactylos carnosus]|uniref:Tumor protein D54 n=1 Tax=Didymodactylos carnosus TaxID=1234261 RepID=A0A815BIY6_9BILA|nr:unnamed protein product [Didymodactylos carnosus]CAF1270981.1 unnamed protein product [Didymodactylos carnosus]CAF3779082.1 unnamed protein product [Didymodactylos carnosus]CAF4059118.1 unnamed protein product [Didymodactylos carnosus]
MPKPFDSDHALHSNLASSSTASSIPSTASNQQFELREDDRLKQEEDYRQELMKVQDEIVTLRQVLGAKLKRENELKQLLGVGFVDDLKQDWNETISDIKSTHAYQKTAETLKTATDKLTPTIQSVNTSLKTKLGSLRSSSYFKTFEDKLGSGLNAVKTKMTQSKSAMNFNRDGDENLSSGVNDGIYSRDESMNFSNTTSTAGGAFADSTGTNSNASPSSGKQPLLK